MATGKQYGLILNKRTKAKQTTARPSVFGDSSDEEDARAEVNTSLAREGRRKLEAKATRELLQSALTEDPTVFEYDTVYDNMQQNKIQAQAKKQVDKDRKPRYIQALKKAAVERKREQDICFERKVQKEREAEGDMFADKEAFMTSAYKKEMIERAAMEERLRREAEIEEANDVTKQKDMSRFYQHLLKQTAQEKPVSATTSIIREMEKPTEKKATEETRDNDDRPDGSPLRDDEATSPLPDTSPVHENTAPSSSPEPDPPSAAEIAAAKREQRKIASAKRSTDTTVLSARDRYLARKKAKLSEPVVGSDDDD